MTPHQQEEAKVARLLDAIFVEAKKLAPFWVHCSDCNGAGENPPFDGCEDDEFDECPGCRGAGMLLRKPAK